MFTNEGRTIIDAIKDFLFETLFTVMISGMGLTFGILMTTAREESQIVVLGYILIMFCSGAGAVMIRDGFDSMMHTINRAKEEMKTKEETI